MYFRKKKNKILKLRHNRLTLKFSLKRIMQKSNRLGMSWVQFKIKNVVDAKQNVSKQCLNLIAYTIIVKIVVKYWMKNILISSV
jgi:hypothetical protein